eukprot:9168692-Karenia_brevis.AAC.1
MQTAPSELINDGGPNNIANPEGIDTGALAQDVTSAPKLQLPGGSVIDCDEMTDVDTDVLPIYDTIKNISE